MLLRYRHLSPHPTVFLKMTGLRRLEFDELVHDLLPRFVAAEGTRLSRTNRQRGLGGGRRADLDGRDQLLLTVIWLRQYPTHEVLAYLFGVSDSTVSRVIERVLPLLEQAGRATMRMPDPGRKRRRQLDAVEHFRQRRHRHRGRLRRQLQPGLRQLGCCRDYPGRGEARHPAGARARSRRVFSCRATIAAMPAWRTRSGSPFTA